MSGTAVIGIVTFANAVVPVCPVAVKLRFVELPTKFVMVASLETDAVQPVPQPPVVVEITLNVTVAEWVSDPLVPVTVTV